MSISLVHGLALQALAGLDLEALTPVSASSTTQCQQETESTAIHRATAVCSLYKQTKPLGVYHSRNCKITPGYLKKVQFNYSDYNRESLESILTWLVEQDVSGAVLASDHREYTTCG